MRSTRNEGWRSDTCPGCGKQGWCQQHSNGTIICRRGPFEGAERRSDRSRVDYWVKAPCGPRPLKLRAVEALAPADSLTLHLVYCDILQALGLNGRHRRDWHRRGLTDEVIARHFLRSWPATEEERGELAAFIYSKHGATCLQVPGFFVEDGRPMLTGGSGWVLPCWDLSGRVVALKIRSDRRDADPKYYWISSGKRGGFGSGQHARLAWPARKPSAHDRVNVLRVTEGEVKAIVLAEHTGTPTLSVPGVHQWNAALPWLQLLHTERVLLCYDADLTTTPSVASAFLAAAQGLTAAGYAVSLETWGEVQHAAC